MNRGKVLLGCDGMTWRKICVVTGTRAEYGLLYWLMKEIQQDDALELQIIATGMHLSPEFGLTYQTIEQDGFIINEKVEILLSSDTPVGIAKSIGLGVIGFADALTRLSPTIMVVLGDRYEILAAAQAALVANIPIAHIHGGELTEGLIDEAIRHSITKMSLWHFTSTERYRKRVIQLGEAPERVFNVGAVGLDNINKLPLLNLKKFEKSINFKLGRINFLVTYHPVTLSPATSQQRIQELLRALNLYSDAHIIFTQANADTGGRVINQELEKFVSVHANRMLLVKSLGQIRYLSAIQHVDAVLGNSSSGLIEVPSFRKPTINIGDRQKGRIKALSVIDCKEDSNSIQEAIRTALSETFQRKVKTVVNPYRNGNVAERIVAYLKVLDIAETSIMKKFHDLELRL